MRHDPSKSFGKRGVSDGIARARNPYTGLKMPIHGEAGYGSLGSVDEGLRAFMLRVYNLMAAGIGVTGLVALLTYLLTVTGDQNLAAVWDDGTAMQITKTEYLNDLGALLWMTPISFLVCFGPLLIIIFTSKFWRRMSASAAFIAFFVLAAVVGVSCSGFALTYTNGSIAQMFFATAAGFGGLSLYGYTTGKDLSGWGSFLWMGLFGVIGAMIINIIFPSDAVHFAICIMGVIVFSGFTAYDTQMIKQAYSANIDREELNRLAISGALDLYLDFINLLQFLLALFGTQED
jgi:uncharacterized protein